MPEGLEAEIYREAAVALVGSQLTAIEVDLACGDPVALSALIGSTVLAARRHGKQVLLDTTKGVLGLHFGMTGRLIIDGSAPIEHLEYGARRDDPRWDRLTVRSLDRTMRVNDPRRWSRYVIDPDISKLGVDVLASTREIRSALHAVAHRSAPVKAVLLDQSVIAGIGNLIADEVCFVAGYDPRRPFASLDRDERAALAAVVATVARRLRRLGGSHMGATGPAIRSVGANCPLDGTPFVRDHVAGRTTLWCPVHQR
jgi:formamidopyrimidine-DNA glycosylase